MIFAAILSPTARKNNSDAIPVRAIRAKYCDITTANCAKVAYLEGFEPPTF